MLARTPTKAAYNTTVVPLLVTKLLHFFFLDRFVVLYWQGRIVLEFGRRHRPECQHLLLQARGRQYYRVQGECIWRDTRDTIRK